MKSKYGRREIKHTIHQIEYRQFCYLIALHLAQALLLAGNFQHERSSSHSLLRTKTTLHQGNFKLKRMREYFQ